LIREAIAAALGRQDVDEATMERAMEEILGGEATPAQIAAFAVALRMKGESAAEIAAAARVMRRRCEGIALDVGDGVVMDTCGTGGDGSGTFNVSTVAAIVVAASGVMVAKHGNRAISSNCGSADVLEALGVAIETGAELVERSLREVRIAFLFAPAHHGALRHAAPVRRELGVRTFFNLLGPLANPAGATHQLLGVYDPERVTQLAHVLALLGSKAAWVVHGEGGLDEVSPCGPTEIACLDNGRVTERVLEPEDFGLARVDRESLRGGDARHNASIARAVLDGEHGAPRTAVVINAGAALCVAGVASSPREGAERAAQTIDSGMAKATLEKWARMTRENAAGTGSG